MKGIVKTVLIFVAVFSTSFVLNSIFGWITADNVSEFMQALRASPNAVLWITLLVIGLLAADSVLAVPTITTVVLAGYFLGPLHGGAAASAGILLAGLICYTVSRYGGDVIFRRIIAPDEAARLREWFERSGGVTLILSRSLPMLPEVLSCLAGLTRMRAERYFLLFALGNVPFAFLAAWAGSVSTLEKPWPALVVGMGVPAAAWLVWYMLRRGERSESAA